MSDLDTQVGDALGAIKDAASLDALDALRVSLLGKSGLVTEQLKALGKLPPDQRKAHGEKVNRAKESLNDAIHERRETLEQAALNARLVSESIDVTLPGRNGARGNLHPIIGRHCLESHEHVGHAEDSPLLVLHGHQRTPQDDLVKL